MTKLVTVSKIQEPSRDAVPQSSRIRELIHARKKTEREPLTPAKVLSTNGLQALSEGEAVEVVDTIKKLSALLFEMHCQKESTCIDNQQVVSLMNENKAA